MSKECLRARAHDVFDADLLSQYMMQKDEDAAICAFGPDYFRGVRLGSGSGAMFCAMFCRQAYSRLRKDQSEVDFDSGVRHGQRNPNFSAWRIIRGLRTQPMLTLACLSTGTTTVLKLVKCYLAHRRCAEFLMDDADFEMMQQLCQSNREAETMLAAVCLTNVDARTARGEPSVGATRSRTGNIESLWPKVYSVQQSTGSNTLSPADTGLRSDKMKQSLPGASSQSRATNIGSYTRSPDDISSCTKTIRGNVVQTLMSSKHDLADGADAYSCSHSFPTFGDGVAVGLMGSIMDCYVPQKPVSAYYNRKFGLA